MSALRAFIFSWSYRKTWAPDVLVSVAGAKGYVDCQLNPCGENDPGRRCMEILDPQGKVQNPEEEKLLSGYQKD
jgi:hypothetical protein